MMKKLALALLAALVLFSGFIGCRSMFGRGEGPIESFAFLAAKNPELPENVVGTIVERPDPKEIVLVVPPGSFVRSLIATISLNTEATITVISSGSRVVQDNGVTPNDFSTPILYSIEVPGDKEPWQYRVTVREADTNAKLARLSFPEGFQLEPTFNPALRSYSVEVPYGTQSVRIQAQAESRYLKGITVDGRMSPGASVTATVDFAAGQERSVEILSLAEDGVSQERYTLLIRRGEPDRNASLAGLEVEGATLSPTFSPARLAYRAEVPFSARQVVVRAPGQSPVASVTIIPTGAESAALQVKGDPATGAEVPFAEGTRLPLAVRVTAEDGSSQDYLVEILRAEPDRNNLLAILQVSEGALTPPFAANRIAYVAAVPFSSRDVTVVARPQSTLATVTLSSANMAQQVLSFEGNPTSERGARIPFASGARLPLLVLVTAEDGTERTYNLEIRRSDPDSNANLAAIESTQGILVPAFSPKTVTYTLVLPAEAASVELSATTQSPVAAVGLLDDPSVRPKAALRLNLTVDPGGSREISLIATAEDGNQKLYRVVLKREAAPAALDQNAMLMGLQVLGARLEPSFTPGVTSYAARVAPNTESVTIAALPQSPGAQVLVDGQPIPAAGRRIPVMAGYTRVVQIEVRAEGGSVMRYSVQIVPDTGTGGATPPPGGGEGQPPAGGSSGPTLVGAHVTVLARNLRLEDREQAALMSVRDRIGPQAQITVRYYRSQEVLAQDAVPISARQQGKNWAVSLQYASAGLTLDSTRLVEIETAIQTSSGASLHYTEAQPAAEEMTLELPFLLYDRDPGVQWPPVGSRVQVQGYVSVLPPGQSREQRGTDRADFPRNDKGEFGITVELYDSSSGRLLAKDTVWNRPGLPRGQRFGFSQAIELNEGSTVRYVLTARERNGRVWQSSGTTTVWTTQPAYPAGFEPATLFVADDLGRP
jgi:hypothetical protein